MEYSWLREKSQSLATQWWSKKNYQILFAKFSKISSQ